MINKDTFDKLNTSENRESARDVAEGLKNKDSATDIAKDVRDNYSNPDERPDGESAEMDEPAFNNGAGEVAGEVAADEAADGAAAE